jgi:4-amino-4-deoxy-L-arabinose transferase-like glycosyltransferase
MTRKDYLLLAAYCAALFGAVLALGGPLTMHEGVLAQTSRAMLADHDWVVPKFGAAPWLERPPLPQWITVAIGSALGGCDREWVVRLGSALMGTLGVLLAARIASVWFGRGRGLLTGLILATMYEFVRYATLAEADMFLCPLVAGAIALFVEAEFVLPRDGMTDGRPLIGRRPWTVLGFFVMLGLSNLAKGMVFGMAMVAIPVGGFLLANAEGRAWRRYLWLWGVLAALVPAVLWPLVTLQRYPDALEVWKFDLVGRLREHYLEEPRLYYLITLPWVQLPWSLPAAVGLGLTAGPMLWQRGSPQRFLWCWAVLVPAVFSYAQGKHHHYLIHCLPAWAMLAALGAAWAWEQAVQRVEWRKVAWAGAVMLAAAGDVALLLLGKKLPGPDWLVPVLLAGWPVLVLGLCGAGLQRDARIAIAASFALLGSAYVGGFAYKGQYLHRSAEDTAFLRQARGLIDPAAPLFIHPSDEALEGLRMLFYFDARAAVLYNFTLLRDERYAAPAAYVITRFRERDRLDPYGTADVVLQSRMTRRETSADDRWTLFRLRFHDGLQRRPGPGRISPMQAMLREGGPFLD